MNGVGGVMLKTVSLWERKEGAVLCPVLLLSPLSMTAQLPVFPISWHIQRRSLTYLSSHLLEQVHQVRAQSLRDRRGHHGENLRHEHSI